MKKRYLLIIPIVILAFLAYGFYFILSNSGLGIDQNHLPQFIQADFVDLSKIYSISKFRSLSGHDFSGGGETCRSMKHYFDPQLTAADMQYMSEHQGIPKPPDGKTDISIFSPVDGQIVDVSEEHTPIGKQVNIAPAKANQFRIRLFHIFLDEAHKTGTKVKAGEKIGVIGAAQGTDISVQVGTFPWNENFVSYFSVMPDSVFKAYQDRGVSSRDDFIFTKAYRDAHAVTCEKKGNEQFNLPADYDQSQDIVALSGYVAPVYNQGPKN